MRKDATPALHVIDNLITKAVYGLHEQVLSGGKGDKKKTKDVDPAELQKGIKVEREHTDDPAVAREIAMDHLTENPSYYSKLEKSGIET